MNHPFALDISDLEAVELDLEAEISDEEALQVGGGLSIYTDALHENGETPELTTLAVGEEGGDCKPYPLPCYPIKPPITKARWEDGGPIFTKALWENGDPIATTLAIGEEGGDCDFYV